MRLCARNALMMLLLLVAASSRAGASVTLRWTAPGNDSLTGRATRYDLRYAPTSMTPATFSLATAVTGLPLPSIAGKKDSVTMNNLPTGRLYFAIKTVDAAGNWSGLSNVVMTLGQTASIRIQPVALSPSWPNPARAFSTFTYTTPAGGTIDVHAFDAMGRHVRTVTSGWFPAGSGAVSWDLHDDVGRRVAAGVYLVHCQIHELHFVRRVVVVT